MNKPKRTNRREHKMEALLKSLGMSEVLAQLDEVEESTILTAGDSWNKAFEEGRKATAILEDLKQPEDYAKAWEKMKVPTNDELGMVDTIDEFKAHTPSFCIAEVILDFDFAMPHQPKRRFQKGQQICMVPANYKYYNDKKRCLKPGKKVFRDIYKRYNGEDLTGKTLFAWRAGGIGDLLFIRPILVHLKQKYKCKIIFATKASYHDMVGGWSDAIDGLCDVDFSVEKTIEAADYHITFEGLIERCRAGYDMDVHDLFARYINLDPDEINWVCPMPIPVTENPFFKQWHGKYCVMQMRASARLRTPFMNSYRMLANAITARGYKVIVVDAPYCSREVDELIQCCERQDMMINFAMLTTGLRDLVRLVNEAAFVVAPDSACTHLAAMQDKPCVSLYGSFPARVRTARYEKCIAIDTPPSDVCPHGGRECFIHATHGDCKYQYGCWKKFENNVAVDAANKIIDILEDS